MVWHLELKAWNALLLLLAISGPDFVAVGILQAGMGEKQLHANARQPHTKSPPPKPSTPLSQT